MLNLKQKKMKPMNKSEKRFLIKQIRKSKRMVEGLPILRMSNKSYNKLKSKESDLVNS